MLTCKCTWRKRATRRSGWVARMRNCCGVFRRASWARACLPAPPPSIDPPPHLAPLPAHTPTINDTINGNSCINSFFFVASSPRFLFVLFVCFVLYFLTTMKKGGTLHDVVGQTQMRLFFGEVPLTCDAKSSSRNFISDLKNCINDKASYCSRGDFYFYSTWTPRQTDVLWHWSRWKTWSL